MPNSIKRNLRGLKSWLTWSFIGCFRFPFHSPFVVRTDLPSEPYMEVSNGNAYPRRALKPICDPPPVFPAPCPTLRLHLGPKCLCEVPSSDRDLLRLSLRSAA